VVNELRWHPLLRQWVSVAGQRQDRPQMPAGWCPFCPGSGRVPDHYDVFLYPNDFAAFRLDNPPHASEPGLFTANGGATDVVLYHPDHNLTMPHPHGQIYAFPFLPPLIERERCLTMRRPSASSPRSSRQRNRAAIARREKWGYTPILYGPPFPVFGLAA
jgi:galactose-1-phosphate uridylyltransferase